MAIIHLKILNNLYFQKLNPIIEPRVLRIKSLISQIPIINNNCIISTITTIDIIVIIKFLKALSLLNIIGKKIPSGTKIIIFPIILTMASLMIFNVMFGVVANMYKFLKGIKFTIVHKYSPYV